MKANNPEFTKCVYKNLNRIFMNVRAKPGSKKEGIQSIGENEIYVCLKAPPVDGKANANLIKYFSEIFKISKSDVVLEKGGLNKNKLVSIVDIYSLEEVNNILNDNLI